MGYNSIFTFSEFPSGCTSYEGPHNVTCFQTVWSMAGCLEEGYSHIRYALISENSALNKHDLRYVKEKQF